MKKGFFSEFRRLNSTSSSKRWFPITESGEVDLTDYDSPAVHKRNREKINKSRLATLVEQLDNNADNLYRNDDVWELYYRFNYFACEDWYSMPWVTQNLALCMAELDSLELFVPGTYRSLKKLGFSEEELSSNFNSIYSDFLRKIVTDCYAKGKFKSEDFYIKVRDLKE